jgi:Secretion system C-terminal sorting domain/PKD-like domain
LKFCCFQSTSCQNLANILNIIWGYNKYSYKSDIIVSYYDNASQRNIVWGKAAITCLRQLPTPVFTQPASSPFLLDCNASTLTLTVSPIKDIDYYKWYLPAGWKGPDNTNPFTTTTNTVVVTPSASASGAESISVVAQIIEQTPNLSSGLSAPATVAVRRTPAVTLNGPATYTCGQPQVAFSVEGDRPSGTVSYTWTLPQGWSSSGTTFTTTTPTILVKPDLSVPQNKIYSIQVAMNYRCGGVDKSVSAFPKEITYNSSRPIVTNTTISPGVVCGAATFTLQKQPPNTTVVWSSSNPNGLVINAATGEASRVNNYNGNVTVTANISDQCGTSPVPQNVSVGFATVKVSNTFFSVCSTSTPTSGNISYKTNKSNPPNPGDNFDGPITNLPPTPQPGTQGCISIGVTVSASYNVTRLRWVFDGRAPIETGVVGYYKYQATCNGQASIPLNVKVAAYNQCGWGPYSCVSLITVDCSNQRATLSACGGSSGENVIMPPLTSSPVAEPEYNVSPNPTSSQLNISTKEPTQSSILSLTLYDKLGNQVLSQSNKNGIQQAQISTSSLPSGFYILHISDGIQTVKKLVLIDK